MDRDSDVNNDILEFYENFQERNNVLLAEIIDYEILEGDGRQFAVYTIEVKTTFMQYLIQKRYSQFLTLKEQLEATYSEIDFKEIEFPGKKFFGNLSPDTLSARKVALNNFIKWLCFKSQDLGMIEFYEFLDIRARYSFDLHRLQPAAYITNESKSQEIEVLFSFLEQLNKNSCETCRILKELNQFYSNQKPKLGSDMIKKLLLGYKKVKGLISFCGKYNEESATHLVCCIGLPFLLNLLSFDQNREAEIYQELFANLHLKQLSCLQLADHLVGKSQRSCKDSALKLLDLYLVKNPSTNPEEILKNEEALKEYTIWKSMHQNSSRKVEQFQITQMINPLGSVSPTEKVSKNSDYEKSAMSPTSQFQNSAETYCSSPPRSLLSLTNKIIKSSLNSNESKTGWTKTQTNKDIEIEHQNHTYVRMKVVVSALPKDCVPFLTENLSWCNEIKEVKILDKNNNSIERYLKYEMKKCQNKKYLSFLSKVKIQDEDENRTIVITERPLQKVPVNLSEDEIMGERNCKIEIKFLKNTNGGPVSKIKFLYKYLDQYSINYSANELFNSPDLLESSLYRLKQMIEAEKYSSM